jgi:hypothetical protein
MSDDVKSNSRRNVLKAGVAVGVGAVAWSGPTITSLGGTPAYAATCTQVAVLSVDLIRDTNTNKSCTVGGYKYLTYQANLTENVPPEYKLNISDVLGQCANVGRVITWTNPVGQKCKVTFKVCNTDKTFIEYNPPPNNIGSTCFERSSVIGTLTLPSLSVASPTNQRDPAVGGPPTTRDMLNLAANGRYGIAMVCVPDDAQCYPDGLGF